MKYYFLPLTNDESKNLGLYGGLDQIRKNPGSLVEYPGLKEISYACTIGASFIIYNNVSYRLIKQYFDIDNECIIHVGKPLLSGGDILRT